MKCKNWDTKKWENINNITWQLLVIVFLMESLFLSARISPIYGEWMDSIREIVSKGLVLFTALFVCVTGIWGFSFVQIKGWENKKYSIVGIGLMIIIQYLIRAWMIPSVQMDDGRVYYLYFNRIVNNPHILLENFFEGGKLAAHIAHGYVFMALIGELLVPGSAVGLQWSQMAMGIGAACCLYKIFRILFPKMKPAMAWLAGFLVSIQPMFLGLSTMCNLEYGITVFFLYAFYCYISRKYILMAFWLLMLGTTKETGVMMAVGFVGSMLLANIIAGIRSIGLKSFIENIKKRFNYKWAIVLGLIIAVLVVFANVVLNMTVWGGLTLKEVISFGGEGNMTFTINRKHLMMKLAQLFVLNFSWIWVIIAVIGMVVWVFDRKSEDKLPLKPLVVLITCYIGYTFFLVFYQEAKQPRYNMLSDVIFLMFALFLLIKMFKSEKTTLKVMLITGLVMFVECFVTIDPLTTKVFTLIETNRLPMVFTATFQSEKAVMDSNAGDFAYYNYQYTFIDRAIEDILAEFSWEGSTRILSASTEIETQFFYDDLRWDTLYERWGYDTTGDQERFRYIRRDNVFDMLNHGDWPDSAVLLESPWCKSELLDGAVRELDVFYEVEGPYECEQGLAGSVIYYFIRLRQE